MHRFIQQINMGRMTIFESGTIYMTIVSNLTIDCLDRCGTGPFIPIVLLVSAFCQLPIILLQNDTGGLPGQLTEILVDFLF